MNILLNIFLAILIFFNLNIEVKAVEEDKYPEATYIWNYLKDAGYNDAVAAGILGNIATECAGSELYLKPLIYSKSGNYYGICQWGLKWYPEIAGLNLEEQCDFLLSNIEKNINHFGEDYFTYFDYDAFVSMKDEKDAALAFAKCYERCHSSSYEERQKNATFVLKHYTGAQTMN